MISPMFFLVEILFSVSSDCTPTVIHVSVVLGFAGSSKLLSIDLYTLSGDFENDSQRLFSGLIRYN